MEKAAAFFTRQIMPLDEFNTFSTGGAISYLFYKKILAHWIFGE